MDFFSWMVSLESRTFIYRNTIHTDMHSEQQMVLQIRYFNSVVYHDVICSPH